MNLIKLNPFKKLMLVVLSWFVHSVYNVEVHAWHIGSQVTTVTNMSEFDYVPYGDDDWAKCAGWPEDSRNLYYIFPLNPTLTGAFYVYHPDTKKYGSVPTSGVLCLTAEEFNAMQSFFGNEGKNWGNCRAFDCAYQYVTQCAESHYNSSPKTYVDGWAFPVLIATRSDFIAGSGFSSALADAYTGGKVQVPGGGGAYMSGCYLKPGKYINSTVFKGSWASVVSNCKEGYYCPGGSYVGSGMQSLTQGAGSFACSKGYYCPDSKMTSGLPCDYAMYQDQVGKTSCKPCPYETVGFRSDAPYNYPYDDTYNRARWAEHPRSDVKNCFLASNTTFNDGTGAFTFTGSCYYS